MSRHTSHGQITLYDRVHRRFLIEQELAERWSKSRRTLQRMRVDGTGPAYHRIGGSVLYKIEDVEAYEAAFRVGRTTS